MYTHPMRVLHYVLILGGLVVIGCSSNSAITSFPTNTSSTSILADETPSRNTPNNTDNTPTPAAARTQTAHAKANAMATTQKRLTATAQAVRTRGAQWAATAQAENTLSAIATSTRQSEATQTARPRQTLTLIAQATATAQSQSAYALRNEARQWNLVTAYTFDQPSQEFPDSSFMTEATFEKKQVRDGKYYWEIKQPDLWLRKVFLPAPLLADFYLTAEVQHLEGNDNTEHGVLFRNDENGNYYLFQITNRQEYLLSALFKDEWQYLSAYMRSSAIKPNAMNRLEVIARGSQLTFFVNDQFVMQVSDDHIAEGTFALVAVPQQNETAVFAFDNVTMRSPLQAPTATPTATVTATRKPTVKPKPTNTPAPLASILFMMLGGTGQFSVGNGYNVPVTLKIGETTYTIPAKAKGFVIALPPGHYEWTATAPGFLPGSSSFSVFPDMDTALGFTPLP